MTDSRSGTGNKQEEPGTSCPFREQVAIKDLCGHVKRTWELIQKEFHEQRMRLFKHKQIIIIERCQSILKSVN